MSRVLWLDGIFQAGRSFFGAVSAAYLVSRGIPLSALGALKMLQSLVGAAAELPSGVFSDRFGHRAAMGVSIVLGACAFMAFAFAHDVWGFALAETLLALSLAFWSGAYDAYAIEFSGIAGNAESLGRFFHLRSSLGAGLTLASGLLGGVVATWGFEWTYLLSAGAFVWLGLWFWGSFPAEPTHAVRAAALSESALTTAKAAFQECYRAGVLQLFFGFFLMEIILQPLIYYWQPWFLDRAPSLGTSAFGSIYSVLQVAVMGAGLVFARLSRWRGTQGDAFWIGCWLAFSITLLALGAARGVISGLAWFALAEVCFVVGESAMKARFNHAISSQRRASCLSVLGLGVRFGSLVSLGISSLLLARAGDSGISAIFWGAGALGVVLCLALAVSVCALTHPVPRVAFPTSSNSVSVVEVRPVSLGP